MRFFLERGFTRLLLAFYGWLVVRKLFVSPDGTTTRFSSQLLERKKATEKIGDGGGSS
jgi:hypothetical protein